MFEQRPRVGVVVLAGLAGVSSPLLSRGELGSSGFAAVVLGLLVAGVAGWLGGLLGALVTTSSLALALLIGRAPVSWSSDLLLALSLAGVTLACGGLRELAWRLSAETSRRKAAESAASERSALLEDAVHIARLGIWEVDLRTQVGRWSPDLLRMYGRDPSEPPSWEELVDQIHPGDYARIRGKLDAPDVNGARGFDLAHRVVLPDGAVRSLQTTARIVTKDGAARLVGTTRDVTDEKRGQNAMARAERHAALSALVAGIAHELNNPLAVIQGNLDLADLSLTDACGQKARDDVVEDLAALRVHISTAIDASERIALLARGLQRVARPPRGEADAVDLNKVVRDVAARAQSEPIAPILLGLTAETRPWAVAGDVRDILEVLLDNALDATDSLPLPRIAVRSRDEPNAVVLEVEDNGRGILDDDVPRVFTPLFTTKSSGTGLALSLAHSTAIAQGGSLSFETWPGRGSCFRLRLPIAKAAT